MSEAEASDVTEQKFGLRGPDGYHKNPLVAKLQAKLAEKSAALATAAEVGKIILEKNAAMERSLQLAKDQLQRERTDHAALLEELKKVNSEPELVVGQCDSDSAEEAALRRQLEKLQAELKHVSRQSGELSMVGNHLEEEVRRLQLEERLNEATLETREERITQLQKLLESQEVNASYRTDRVSAMAMELSRELAGVTAERDCALEELQFSLETCSELEDSMRQLQHQLDEKQDSQHSSRTAEGNELSENAARRVAQRIHLLLQAGDAQNLSVLQLSEAVLGGSVHNCSEGQLTTPNRLLLEAATSPRSRRSSARHSMDQDERRPVLETTSEDDALHEFFCMLVISINLGRVDRGALAVPRRMAEQLYREVVAREVPLHKWNEWTEIEMERLGLRMEDLDHHNSSGELRGSTEGTDDLRDSATELGEALAGGNSGLRSSAEEFGRSHDVDCTTQ